MKNFLSTVFGAMAIALMQPQIILAQTETEILATQERTREFTVQIYDPNSETGSGVIISRNGNTYYVLTAAHVVPSGANAKHGIELETVDKKPHQVNTEVLYSPDNIDLALIKFESDREYPVATISQYSYPLYERRDYQDKASSDASAKKPYVLVSGWPLERFEWKDCKVENGEELPSSCEEAVVNPGFLFDNSGTAISSPDIADPEDNFGGYELVYTNLTHIGMSGGPVLDTQGRLIGIHGRADAREIGEEDEIIKRYIDENGGSEAKIELGMSMGVPIRSFLNWIEAEQSNPVRDYLIVEESAPPSIEVTEIQATLPPLSIDEDNNDNPYYLIEKGNQLWRIGDGTNARGSFENATKLKDDLYLAWFAKGFVSGFDGLYDRALEACTRAVELNVTPNDIKYESHRCRAGALQQLNRPEEALSALEEAISIEQNPEPGSDLQPDKNPADFMFKGELLYALGRHEESLAALQQAITLRVEQKLSDSPLLYNNLALVKLELGQYQSAKDDTDMAIAIDDNFAPAYRNQGLILETMDRNEESLAAYDKALELDPEDYNTLTNKGFALYKMERVDEAKQAFERAKEINPDYQPAIDNLEAIESAN